MQEMYCLCRVIQYGDVATTCKVRFLELLNARTFSFACNLLWNFFWFFYWAFLYVPSMGEFIEWETGFDLWWYTLRMGGDSPLQSLSCKPARDKRCFFLSRASRPSQVTSVLQARDWICILREIKKENKESNQGSKLQRNDEKMMKVGLGLDMPFQVTDSIDFAEKHTHQSGGIV